MGMTWSARAAFVTSISPAIISTSLSPASWWSVRSERQEITTLIVRVLAFPGVDTVHAGHNDDGNQGPLGRTIMVDGQVTLGRLPREAAYRQVHITVCYNPGDNTVVLCVHTS